MRLLIYITTKSSGFVYNTQSLSSLPAPRNPQNLQITYISHIRYVNLNLTYLNLKAVKEDFENVLILNFPKVEKAEK